MKMLKSLFSCFKSSSSSNGAASKDKHKLLQDDAAQKTPFANLSSGRPTGVNQRVETAESPRKLGFLLALQKELEKCKTEQHRLRERVGELAEENVSLQREKLQQVMKCTTTEEDRDLYKRKFESKDEECKELHKVVTRLLGTTNEQEKTIQGLRETQHLRLTAVDQQLENSIHCLQNQGTGLINDSVRLCQKLIENIKEKAYLQNGGLDSQFIMESEMKLQGFKRGAKSLARGLQTVSNVQREKSSMDDNQEDGLVLMTSLLREKLYSKEVDVERLEAELATAVRGNDILRCQVQNSMDDLSCITHKMKNLEMQVVKKDESIYHLQENLQECRKEVAIVNGLLPLVCEERDMIWHEVKQYSEKCMLLTSEVGTLKKKVEALDEELLLKEGQLKDALENPVDLLSIPIPSRGFMV